MTSTVKTIGMWILILAAAVGLYSFVERSSSSARVLNLTDLLARVENREVEEVVIQGETLRGKLKAGNEGFTSTIPPNYTVLYDRLTASGVRVMIVPPRQDWWANSSLILVIGSLLWLGIAATILVIMIDLSRFVKHELARKRESSAT